MTGTPATPALRRFSHLRIGTLSGGQLDEGERRMLRSGSYSRDVICPDESSEAAWLRLLPVMCVAGCFAGVFSEVKAVNRQ